MKFSKIALVSAFALTHVALTHRAAAAEEPVAQVQEGSLAVARNGSEVLVSWVLPPGDFRMIEVFRNTNPSTSGRGRASKGRPTAIFLDTVPDLSVKYYYWLKLTRPDNTILNIGPVGTPSPTVWQP